MDAMPKANESGVGGGGGHHHSKHDKGRKPSSSKKDAGENSVDHVDDLAEWVYFTKLGGDSKPVGACLRAGTINNKDGGGHVAVERGASLQGTTTSEGSSTFGRQKSRLYSCTSRASS